MRETDTAIRPRPSDSTIYTREAAEMGLFDFTYYDIICRNAGLFKQKTAWYEAETTEAVSFQELKKMTDSLASGLRTRGIGKGDRIGVLAKNSLQYFLLYGAAAALGAVMLPINWRLSAGEVCFNLNDGQTKIVFADEEFGETISKIRAELPIVERFYALSGKIATAGDFYDLIMQADDFQPEDLPADSGFVIIHTAAVAGRPRGALLSHTNIVFSSLEFIRAMSLQAADVHLNILPLFHVGGLFMTISC
ncbi:MAG: AMP-binding protein, partial [Desulfoprunum sp.]|nr:AMP-binding protein [Desulfoprunum sp.]